LTPHFQSLSAALARLSSLRTLVIGGWVLRPRNVAAGTAAHLSASEHLAAAIGALTSLNILSLSDLPFLQEHTCHVHLTGLTALTRLTLTDLAPGLLHPGAPQDVGQALVSMLAGMTRLSSLQVTDKKTSKRATLRVLSEAVPALPLLETLFLPAGVDSDDCMALAHKIQAGSLERLRLLVARMGPVPLAHLNSAAGRDVFSVLWWPIGCGLVPSSCHCCRTLKVGCFSDDGSQCKHAASHAVVEVVY
jgi:hypothetical protein